MELGSDWSSNHTVVKHPFRDGSHEVRLDSGIFPRRQIGPQRMRLESILFGTDLRSDWTLENFLRRHEVRLDSGNFPETDPAKIGLRIFLKTSSQDGSCQDWTRENFPRRILPRLDLGFFPGIRFRRRILPRLDSGNFPATFSQDGSWQDWAREIFPQRGHAKIGFPILRQAESSQGS
jgi:hypothetical protein